MKTKAHKYILDAILIILILTLYSKNVINLMYHEVAGLIICGLFIIHLIFNRKWITGVMSKVFSPKITVKAKVTCVVDILLLASWAGVAVTGIMISKKLFSFHIESLTPFHLFFAGAGLILTGIHLGLHTEYIQAVLRKIPGIRKIKRPVTTILMILLLLVGGYSFAGGSMTKWISAPFSQSSEMAGHELQNGNANKNFAQSSISQNKQNEAGLHKSATTGKQISNKENMHGQESFHISNLLKLIVNIFSMLYVIMMITYWIEMMFRKMKKSKNEKRA